MNVVNTTSMARRGGIDDIHVDSTARNHLRNDALLDREGV